MDLHKLEGNKQPLIKWFRELELDYGAGSYQIFIGVSQDLENVQCKAIIPCPDYNVLVTSIVNIGLTNPLDFINDDERVKKASDKFLKEIGSLLK